jgi:CRISPR-associated endonuclease/helicase Cas3
MANEMTILLAKSVKQGQAPKTLVAHSLEVMEAFVGLFGTLAEPTRLGQRWLAFFGLPNAFWPNFYRHGLAAAGLHDPGKANSSFQQAIQNKGEQAIRHEHLSALIVALPQVSRWLQHGGLNAQLVAVVAASHHLKLSASDERYKLAALLSPGANLVEILGEQELASLFESLGERLELAPWKGRLPTLWNFGSGLGESITALRDDLNRRMQFMKREWRKDRQKRRLWQALVAALIAADAAGSGLPREGLSIPDWLSGTFGVPPLTGNCIREQVIDPRIAEIEASKRRIDPDFRFRWQDFQEAAERLPERALLLAGCGSGKTLAAWRWIAAQLDRQPAARVIFLYPTRATASEGFRDYVSHAPESDAALLSGTARYELEGMFSNPDERSERNYETDDRLFALGFWQKRVFSATVDQFLGFLQLSYRSVCLLPVLADAVVVIDEVHSFDHRLWTALKTLLKEFRLPVLCMTASLPGPRRLELAELALTPYPGPGRQFQDLERSAQLRRYRIHAIPDESVARAIAQTALTEGKRVLWVVNTVDRCQRLARNFEQLGALCYHSRFTLRDRKERHTAVVAAFQSGRATGGIIALTTQVCEMSLDLDADVLITELAPIPSLIQRMGRCNRHARDEANPGIVYCYTPASPLPYNLAEVEPAHAFLASLDRQAVSQSRLEDELEARTRQDPRRADTWIQFVEGAPWAAGGEEDLRDSHDFTVDAVLDCDLEQVLGLRRRHQPYDGFVLPVPRRHASRSQRLGRALSVAPADHYDTRFGFFQEPIHGRQT